MPLWIFLVIAAVALAIIFGPWAVRAARSWWYEWRHAEHVITEATAEFGPPDASFRGSMNYYDEHPERHPMADWTGHPLVDWNASNAASSGAWDHREAFYNGHTWGCLRPTEDHPGACPEEGDWPDDAWPPEVPYVPAPGPVEQQASLVDTPLALAAEDPEDAGWTDQLLAALREAPTVLDGPSGSGTDDLQAIRDYWSWTPGRASCGHEANEDGECGCAWWPERAPVFLDDAGVAAILANNERLADTGEIDLAALRAQYAADLKAQEAEHAEYMAGKEREAARQLVDGL